MKLEASRVRKSKPSTWVND